MLKKSENVYGERDSHGLKFIKLPGRSSHFSPAVKDTLPHENFLVFFARLMKSQICVCRSILFRHTYVRAFHSDFVTGLPGTMEAQRASYIRVITGVKSHAEKLLYAAVVTITLELSVY